MTQTPSNIRTIGVEVLDGGEEADLPVVGIGSGTGAGDWRSDSSLTPFKLRRATELPIYIELTGIALSERFSWRTVVS